MNRKLIEFVVFCGASASVIWAPGLAGQDTPPADARVADLRKTVLPFLDKNCFSCHNEKLKTGALSLEPLRDVNAALGQTAVWEKVLDKLSAGKMPPPGMPAPPKSDIAAVTAWIEQLLGRSASIPGSDPGRVTARRLNRAEYNNTIRDLLGVSLRPADEFPLDDSGYGFDNIGDVLSLSPMLMEKYMAAARKLSRLAVYGEPLPAQATTIGHYLGKHSNDARRTLEAPNITPFSLRGSIYTTHLFPW